MISRYEVYIFFISYNIHNSEQDVLNLDAFVFSVETSEKRNEITLLNKSLESFWLNYAFTMFYIFKSNNNKK